MSGNDPVVTVWRNRIPYICTLTYWGRKWRFRNDRRLQLRRMHMWTVHAPVDDGEVISFDSRHRARGHWNCWDNFECYNADGTPLIIGDKADDPS